MRCAVTKPTYTELMDNYQDIIIREDRQLFREWWVIDDIGNLILTPLPGGSEIVGERQHLQIDVIVLGAFGGWGAVYVASEGVPRTIVSYNETWDEFYHA